MQFFKYIFLSVSVFCLSSCSLAKFGDYKPLYFDSESDLKNANVYLESLGVKTISEYNTTVNILDFPEQKDIFINEIKNINNSDIRKDEFLKKLTNLFNLENKKVLYVEKNFKDKDLTKLNEELGTNGIGHGFKYETKINYFLLMVYLIIIMLLLVLNKGYFPFILSFFLISLIVFIFSENSMYFYPITILSYLLFSLIDNFNKNYNKIYLKDISFEGLIKRIKYPLILFIFIIFYFSLVIIFAVNTLEPLFIIFISVSTLCIFLIFTWVKTEKNFQESFLFPIEIKEQRKEQKIIKIKSIIYYSLFLLSIIPFFYSMYVLSSYKNFSYFYSKKLSYFDYLNPSDIYLMLGYNENLPNIVDYLSHELYQDELKYKITSEYGVINRKIIESYFETKNNKITINPRTVYKVDKDFIDKKLEKDIAKLFLNKNKPILIYKETSSNIETKKNEVIKLFIFSLPFFILLFLFKAIRFTILLNINKKNYKKYIKG